MHTRNYGVRVPDALFAEVVRALDAPADMRPADVIRTALARVAGVDVADHTPRATGRPPGPDRAKRVPPAEPDPEGATRAPIATGRGW
ncbi:hypothetical protein [Candidatus Frankia alpina]|uniref:Uncharacterized protein n=1 Tax=Candidatus Frankia alpina TaxID=2699483 RepID=A0A4S5ES93_9ACTN|nr:hypothetical protein [Candidatus Frankia alpina]THJ75123.1 hypothetical protein E7Y31_07385 [Candidatus Frankia alpina]